MGQGPAEGGTGGHRLSPGPPAPYLLIYDAEEPGCRRLVDWISRRDQAGLVVAFPCQSPQLLHVAPELAGLALAGAVHGFDTRNRRFHRGPRLLPSLFRRLPGLRWLGLATALPSVAGLLYRFLSRRPRRFGFRN
jgi:hypothetical protein